MRTDEISGLIQRGNLGSENGAHPFFTETETAYCGKRKNCLGARFLVKRCVLDYLACEKGFKGNPYREIEIMNNEVGKPFVRVFGEVQKCVHTLRIKDMFISISHSRNWTTGMVLFCFEADTF